MSEPPRMPSCPICGHPWRCPDHQTALPYKDGAACHDDPDQIAVIRPGQTLVIRYSRRNLSDYEVDQFKAKLAERMPDVNLVILGPDIEPLMIYDPTPEQD